MSEIYQKMPEILPTLSEIYRKWPRYTENGRDLLRMSEIYRRLEIFMEMFERVFSRVLCEV